MMPAGPITFSLGMTWHGGGENRSYDARFETTHQSCEAYIRPQESYVIELSKYTVRVLSPELQALVGYSTYTPLMRMLAGKHPQ